MMLDSTLAKILAAKQVEPPAPVNSEEDSKRGPTGSDASSGPEAEVRLVVKFIVEEQIVFDGKIQRVDQLQIEELSRVVSKVAWSSVSDKLDSSSASNSQKINTDQTNIQSATSTATDNPQPEGIIFINNSIEAPPTSLAEDKTDLYPRRNVKSPDLKVDTKSVSTQTTSIIHENPIIAQDRQQLSTTERSTTVLECDSSLEQTSNFFCETNQKNVQHPTLTPTRNVKDSVGESAQDSQIEQIAIEELPASDSLAEFQSIADTINDCLDSVVLETNRSNSLEYEETACPIPQILNSSSVDTKTIELQPHNQVGDIESTRLFDILTKTSEGVETDTDEATEMVSPSPLTEENMNRSTPETNQQTHQIIRDNVSNSKADSSITNITNKRRPTNDQTNTGKRVRRIPAKDRRDLTSKDHSISKNSDTTNVSIKEGSNKLTSTNNASFPTKNQRIYQNEVFAKWADNHFYPGIILRPAKDRKFVISFFDGAQRNVAEADLIPLSNIKGKQVRLSIARNYCVNAIVHDQRSPEKGKPTFDVEYSNSEGMVRKCVPFTEIFLTGEQGTGLASQQDKNSGASNFADVDLDNIIYEKRSRRLQEMDDFELTDNPTITTKKKRGQTGMRISSRASRVSQTGGRSSGSSTPIRDKLGDIVVVPEQELTTSPDEMKAHIVRPNSNSPSEASSSTGSSNATNVSDLGQEFYFSSSSPHRTKTSVLL